MKMVPALLLSLLSLLLFVSVASGNDNVHIINDAEGLIAFSNDVNSGISSYFGTTVILGNDIVFTEEFSKQSNPIGPRSLNSFNGTFDGQGHVIRGLSLNSSNPMVGLFGYSCGSAVRNVIMDSTSSVKASHDPSGPYYSCVGSILGYCGAYFAPCTLENIVNMADVSYVDKYSSANLFMGGIVGDYDSYYYDVYIRNCANYGTINHQGKSLHSYIGGIVPGCIDSDMQKRMYVQNCANYGNIVHNGTTIGALYMGGIIGLNWQMTSLENCISTGSMTTNRENGAFGTIAGDCDYSRASISSCLWTSDVGNYSVCGSINESIVTDSSLVEVNASTVDEMNKKAGRDMWLYNPYNSTVTFNINGANVSSSKSQMILLPSLASENDEGVFRGWFTERTCDNLLVPLAVGDGDIILYGGWAYDVTFDYENTTKTVIYKQFYGDLPEPTRTGYTFAGWFTEEVGGEEIKSGDVVEITEDKTLYAHWSINKYTVTFNVNGGNSLEEGTKEVTYDSTYGNLPTPNRTGYTFTGWFIDNNFTGKITSETIVSIAGNHTLYAYWTSAFVEIVFGTKDMKESDVLEIVSNYTKGEFVIEKIETSASGETRVIIKFVDEQEAKNFVTIIKAESPLVTDVGFMDNTTISFTPSISPLLFSIIPFLF